MFCALDDEYAKILALLDRSVAVRRMVGTVPAITGLDVAWIGEPDGNDRIVLRNAVNMVTDLVDGLVVPAGTGLGGRVLLLRRPLWVSDYCAAPDISDHFKAEAAAERVRAMIAVPIEHDGKLLGVLYAAARRPAVMGDRIAAALEEVAVRTATAQIVAERAQHAAELAVQEERRRLALEMHDTVGATLYTLGADIRRLGADPGLDAGLRDRLAAVERRTAEAAAALRGSLRVLNAPPEELALGVALREHCRACQERTGLDARVIVLTELPKLEPCQVSALADAAREALLNVAKHAHARSVMVSVFAQRGGIAVTVSDDGDGPPADGGMGDGIGLRAMSERLARMGGQVTMFRNDDDGCTLQAWVPA